IVLGAGGVGVLGHQVQLVVLGRLRGCLLGRRLLRGGLAGRSLLRHLEQGRGGRGRGGVVDLGLCGVDGLHGLGCRLLGRGLPGRRLLRGSLLRCRLLGGRGGFGPVGRRRRRLLGGSRLGRGLLGRRLLGRSLLRCRLLGGRRGSLDGHVGGFGGGGAVVGHCQLLRPPRHTGRTRVVVPRTPKIGAVRAQSLIDSTTPTAERQQSAQSASPRSLARVRAASRSGRPEPFPVPTTSTNRWAGENVVGSFT